MRDLFLSSGASRVLWTLGHLLMIIGVYLVAAIGGVYATVSYQLQAAQGQSDLPPITARHAVQRPALSVGETTSFQPTPAVPFVPPVLPADGRVMSALPAADGGEHRATVSRVVIPSIGVDSKVVEVGWDVVEENGQLYAIWQVAEYAVGQHTGSANPGEGDNIVLAAHVGGYGKVFEHLYYLNPGDSITVYSNGQQYLYTVHERMVVDEEGVGETQRQANAQLLAPTGKETVTLITCWPLAGNARFSQRVIVQALPYGAATPTTVLDDVPGPWTVR